MALLLPDKWTWDFWLARDRDTWHLFMLQADKAVGDPALRHWHASIGHAVSTDLRNWNYLGTALAPNEKPGFDDSTTWTGCTFRHNDEWLMFYTGNAKASDNKIQRIGVATSPDLMNWTRSPQNPLIDNLPAPYENRHYPDRWHDRSLRDPDVNPDPSRGGWRMFFSARTADQPGDSAGCIGQAWSDDLLRWEVLPPAVAPGMAGELEVPQLLHIGDYWYLLFCTAGSRFGATFAAANPGIAAQTGTHYFIADSIDGPWRLGPDMFFAGDTQGSTYAGKMVETESGWVFLGFLNFGPDGQFIGGLADPVPVEVGQDGTLSLRRERA
ncbi:MAG: family 43 glycosylhydrolase [Planctomycetes bacterium]|nr:family 43 glycosylhydrolase [Planctomycetota bacterium]